MIAVGSVVLVTYMSKQMPGIVTKVYKQSIEKDIEIDVVCFEVLGNESRSVASQYGFARVVRDEGNIVSWNYLT